MVTYLYWIAVLASSALLFWAANRLFKIKVAIAVGLVSLLIGWGM